MTFGGLPPTPYIAMSLRSSSHESSSEGEIRGSSSKLDVPSTAVVYDATDVIESDGGRRLWSRWSRSTMELSDDDWRECEPDPTN